MANINVKLKNASGDVLYPKTLWSNIEGKPSFSTSALSRPWGSSNIMNNYPTIEEIYNTGMLPYFQLQRNGNNIEFSGRNDTPFDITVSLSGTITFRPMSGSLNRTVQVTLTDYLITHGQSFSTQVGSGVGLSSEISRNVNTTLTYSW